MLAAQSHLLKPFESEDLKVDPEEKLVIMPDSQQHVDARTICMQFEGNWSPVTDIIVDKVGKYAYTIGSKETGITQVVMDVALDIRTKASSFLYERSHRSSSTHFSCSKPIFLLVCDSQQSPILATVSLCACVAAESPAEAGVFDFMVQIVTVRPDYCLVWKRFHRANELQPGLQNSQAFPLQNQLFDTDPGCESECPQCFGVFCVTCRS